MKGGREGGREGGRDGEGWLGAYHSSSEFVLYVENLLHIEVRLSQSYFRLQQT